MVGALVAALLLTLVAATSAVAEVRHASPAGTGGPGACPAVDPCSLEDAVEGAADSDEVVVAGGSYDLGSSGVSVSNAIDVHAAPGASPLIFSTGGIVVLVSNAGATLTDVRIRSDSASPGSAALLITAGLGRRLDARGGLAASCALHDGRLTDSFCVGPGNALRGISLSGTKAPRAVNVTAISSGAAAVLAEETGGATVNMTISNVIADGQGADLLTVRSTGTATMAVDHSNYGSASSIGGATPPPAPGGTNQDSDVDPPAFVNAAGGDYHQLFGSPTINQGDSGAADLGPTDIDGDPRTVGAGTDMGADEYVPPPPDPDPDPDPGPDPVDRIAPETRFTKTPKKKVTSRKKRVRVKYRFTGTDASARSASASAIAGFECKLDRKAFKPCTSPFKPKVKTKGGKGKKHRVKVRAVDAAGNVDATPAKHSFRAKRKKPRKR